MLYAICIGYVANSSSSVSLCQCSDEVIFLFEAFPFFVNHESETKEERLCIGGCLSGLQLITRESCNKGYV